MQVGDLGTRIPSTSHARLWLVGKPFCLPQLPQHARDLGWDVQFATRLESVFPSVSSPSVAVCSIDPNREQPDLAHIPSLLPDTPVVGLSPSAPYRDVGHTIRSAMFDVLVGEECTPSAVIDAVRHAHWQTHQRPTRHGESERELRRQLLQLRRQRMQLRRLSRRNREANAQLQAAREEARAHIQVRNAILADLDEVRRQGAQLRTAQHQMLQGIGHEVASTAERALEPLDEDTAEARLLEIARQLSALAEDLAAAASIHEPLDDTDHKVDVLAMMSGLRASVASATDIHLRLRIHADANLIRVPPRPFRDALLHLLACGVHPVVDEWIDAEVHVEAGQAHIRFSPVVPAPEAWRSAILIARLGGELHRLDQAVEVCAPVAHEPATTTLVPAEFGELARPEPTWDEVPAPVAK